MEKPMTTDAREAKELAAAVRLAWGFFQSPGASICEMNSPGVPMTVLKWGHLPKSMGV